MIRASLKAASIAALVGLAWPTPSRAAGKATRATNDDAPADASEAKAETAGASDEAARAAENSRKAAAPPESAAAALFRAGAAYEYGDMNQVVEAARPVAEGLLSASPEEQAHAFRLLGIGLYLTNRPVGAQTAFTELLRRNPKARLDPTTTRPEAVAFFENLRREHLTRQRRVIWNFLPPVGQFQNEDNVKGWAILSVGVLSLATAGTTRYLLEKWEQPGHTYGTHQSIASPMKTANWIATGVLAATYIYGVFDGLIGYARPLDDSKPSVAFRVFPEGGVGFAF